MFKDSRSIAVDELVKSDVCIVGAGTAGITLAHTFLNKGLEVSLIESGGIHPDKETQLLSFGENVGHPYFSLDIARPRILGGSTNRWFLVTGDGQFGARMRPLDAIDFEEREEIPYSGWPFGKAHIEPYYHRAEEFCKIDPIGFEVNDWEDPDKAPRLKFNNKKLGTVIFKFGSRDPLLKEYTENIKQDSNIKVMLHANVVDIAAEENLKTIKCIHVACLDGNKFRVSAKMFVLAAGAIETAKLLLLSNKQQKVGLGNQHDLVGRFFMEHLHFWSGLYIPSDPNMFQKTALYNAIHKVKDVPIIGKLALSEDVLRKEKLLNYVMQITPRIDLYSSLCEVFYPAIESGGVDSLRTLRSALLSGRAPDELGRHLANILSSMNDVAKTSYRYLKKKFLIHFNKKKVNLYTLHHMSEQAPNPNSRITLSQERDALGQNRVRLNWQFSPIDIRSAIRAQEIIDEELRRAGLGRLFVGMKDEFNPHPVGGGWHHMGTTRMSDDPQKGVVDRNCKVHGISNLYVAGPSVFPTGGYANPSLTIVALTLRLADHLKELLDG